jgi:hypothetical protein
MNLELLERFRGSYPSRQSFMGFINHCEPESATSKPPTPEPEVPRHTTVDTEVVFDTPTSEVPIATAYEVVDTPNYEAENTLNSEVENSSTREIFDTTTSEVPDASTCEVEDAETCEALGTSNYETEDTPTCEIENTLTNETENTPTCEAENTPTCEVLATPIDETVNTEPSLETSERITDEHHITQEENTILPISTCTNYLAYPKYYETPIYDSVSTERLPPIMEDIVYESYPAYHKTTKHLSIESFITTQQENPEVALDSAPRTSEMTNSEPEITEFTTPDSLDLELELTSPNPSSLILSEPTATRPIINEPTTHNTEPKASKPTAAGLKKRTICFDPNGDLILAIGSGPGRDMLVDSRALSRASPKLHAILSHDGKKNDNSWTLELPEDDPLPFTILLNLIHTRFERIPARVTLKQLYGICILTQKYNMTEVLRPVAERWYKDIGRPSEGEYGLFFKKAFVAWELGFAEDLSEMAGHVVLNCYLDEDDQLVIGKKKEKLSNFSDFQRIPLLSQSSHICLRRPLLTCLRMY